MLHIHCDAIDGTRFRIEGWGLTVIPLSCDHRATLKCCTFTLISYRHHEEVLRVSWGYRWTESKCGRVDLGYSGVGLY
jgi:hypothetical protein